MPYGPDFPPASLDPPLIEPHSSSLPALISERSFSVLELCWAHSWLLFAESTLAPSDFIPEHGFSCHPGTADASPDFSEVQMHVVICSPDSSTWIVQRRNFILSEEKSSFPGEKEASIRQRQLGNILLHLYAEGYFALLILAIWRSVGSFSNWGNASLES